MSFANPISASGLSLNAFSDLSETTSLKPFSFSAGQMLRKAREAHNLTLDQVSQRLCLSKHILEALEQGRYKELSQGEAYVIGFVRSYARLVGVDPQRVTLQMKEELPPPENPPELIFPAPLSSSGHPKKLSLFFSVALTLGGVFWGQEFLMNRNFSGKISLSNYQSAFVPVQVTADAPKDKRLLQEKQKQEGVQETPEFFSLIDQSPPQPAPFLASHQTPLIIETTEKSWVEVRDAQGHLHLNKVMEPGETYEVNSKIPLFLTTGNIGGLRIRQGDSIISSLGKSGSVRRKIPLSFAALKEMSQTRGEGEP